MYVYSSVTELSIDRVTLEERFKYSLHIRSRTFARDRSEPVAFHHFYL